MQIPVQKILGLKKQMQERYHRNQMSEKAVGKRYFEVEDSISKQGKISTNFNKKYVIRNMNIKFSFSF